MELQAYIRPSSMGVIKNCAGYPALNAAMDADFIEEQDNEIREDGIACHWLAAELWNGAVISPGSIAPNGRELTNEMFAAVAEYHAQIRAWGCSHIAMEQKIPVATYFPGVQDGTPDVWGCDYFAHTLYLADLKFGFRPVDVWRNAQLIVYIWTLICWLRAQGLTIERVELAIFQPRVAHRDGYWRTWKPTIAELVERAAELQVAIDNCYSPSPICTVNPGCLNCGAASACSANQASGGWGMEVSYGATPHVLTPAQVGYELARLREAERRLEYRITGLETQAESLLRKGQRVPGFEMGRAGTRYRWRAGTEKYVRRLGELIGVRVVDEPKTLTVAKLRNAFPGLDVQAMFAEKPTGELKLVATDPNEATKRFSQ